MLLKHVQAFFSVIGYEHGIPVLPQHLAHDQLDVRVILDQQNGLRSTQNRLRFEQLLFLCRFRFGFDG